LINFLTARLIELGVPEEFRKIVIDAVLTGEFSGEAAEQARLLYGDVVLRVVDAAYAAVKSGVSISLIVAGCVILASGIVAYLTFTPARVELEQET
jgi:hypothetical protein